MGVFAGFSSIMKTYAFVVFVSNVNEEGLNIC
jgi:hypothetical protein